MRLAVHGAALQGGRPVDAFTVVAELLGDLELTSGQLAQVRAINHKYWQKVYTLLHPPGEEGRLATPGATASSVESLTERQTADLRAMLERDVRAILTPEQRAALVAKRLR
jgi:hypothetical protein